MFEVRTRSGLIALDKPLPPPSVHFVATRMNATIHAVNADHLPMLTHPDSVTEILLTAANHPQ